MSSLVSYIRNRHGRGIVKLPLNRKVPGIDRGKDIRIAANLRIVPNANGNHATRRNGRKDKRGWTGGEIECTGNAGDGVGRAAGAGGACFTVRFPAG